MPTNPVAPVRNTASVVLSKVPSEVLSDLVIRRQHDDRVGGSLSSAYGRCIAICRNLRINRIERARKRWCSGGLAQARGGQAPALGEPGAHDGCAAAAVHQVGADGGGRLAVGGGCADVSAAVL